MRNVVKSPPFSCMWSRLRLKLKHNEQSGGGGLIRLKLQASLRSAVSDGPPQDPGRRLASLSLLAIFPVFGIHFTQLEGLV